MIDTLEFAQRMAESGMDQKVAEALAKQLNTEMEKSNASIVSKPDLGIAVSDLKHYMLQTCIMVCGAVGVLQIGAIYGLVMQLLTTHRSG